MKGRSKLVDRLIWEDDKREEIEDPSQISRLGRWILMSLTETIVSGEGEVESWS